MIKIISFESLMIKIKLRFDYILITKKITIRFIYDQ